ncbi:hypothetical protein B566_EDAN007623, partial [Ephemera danica]
MQLGIGVRMAQDGGVSQCSSRVCTPRRILGNNVSEQPRRVQGDQHQLAMLVPRLLHTSPASSPMASPRVSPRASQQLRPPLGQGQAPFVGGLSLSAFFIIAIWSKWEQNPIIVSLDTTAAIIDDIPFPGVTICNMNKMKRSRVEELTESMGYFASTRSGSAQMNAANRQLMKGMSDILKWRSKSSAVDTNNETDGTSTFIPDVAFFSSGLERFNISAQQDLSGRKMTDFMKEVTPSCKDILKYCRWDSVVSKCENLFQEVTTDDGICCAFNSLSEALVRRDRSEGILNPEQYWTPENGYPPGKRSFPRRGAAPGVSAGLSLLLDVQLHEYFLPRSGSVGFKVLLHSPAEVPAVKEFGFAISPGAESYVSVRPSVVYSTRQIRSLAQSRRKCYFQEERPLAFYRYYSVSSCIAECLANATLLKCGCKEYFMPVISGSRNRKLCDCQPACTELGYSHELSVSQFPTTDVGANTLENLKAAINYTNSLEYFVKNHALLHVFLRDYKVMRYKRASMYDLLDFMANMGGLLSLCLGFSFLSAAEIFYFVCMRCTFFR